MTEPQPPEPERKKMEPLPVSDINKKLKDVYGRLLGVPDPEEAEKIQEEIVARVRYLREKYPDWAKREVIHVISGSGMRVGTEVITDDFTGEDSVEAFLNALVEKYKV